MEERNKSSNGKKNKSQRLGFTVGGGDGVGGIVLLGGGLAVAGLITAFSIIKNSNRKKYDGSANPSNKKQDATQGVSYFLQTPSTTLQQNQNSCITSHETSKIAVTLSHSDSPERLSIHSLALGDQAVPISDGDKENPSNFHSENFSNFSAKEFSLPAPDGSSLAKSEEMIKNESGEKKTVEVKKEDGELETKNLAVEENLPIQLAQEEEGEGDEEQGEEENDDGKSSEDVTEDEEEVESWEEESSLEEHSPIQSVEEEEKEDGAGDGEKEGLIMKEGESSSDEWSVEDEGKRENESGEMRKLAVEQNLPTQSVEEEESDDCSKHNIEEEKGSEGKFPVGENAAIKSAEKEREDSHDNNDEDSAEEHVMEKDEESSEGTVSSSNESNVEAIWPAEIIEALSQELKEMNAINKNSGEKTANKTEKYDFLDCKIKHEDKGNKETTENTANVFHQKPAQLVAMINDLTVNDLNRRIWVWSILVLLLLLLLLLFHIHRTPAAAELVCHDPVMVLPRVE